MKKSLRATIVCAILGLAAGCRSNAPETPRLLIVYGADSTLASQYATALENQGFDVSLLPLKAASGRALARADVLLLTPGAGSKGKQQSAVVKSLSHSRAILVLPEDLAAGDRLGVELHQLLGR
ncbi:MAG: hypothetical protein HY335_03610 [Deinococcus sp.]|nr:hypothetical protein [Deinococcus sp.]